MKDNMDIPTAFKDLMRNLSMIDALRGKVEHFGSINDQYVEDVQAILTDDLSTRQQVRNRIEDFFFTMPARGQNPKNAEEKPST